MTTCGVCFALTPKVWVTGIYQASGPFQDSPIYLNWSHFHDLVIASSRKRSVDLLRLSSLIFTPCFQIRSPSILFMILTAYLHLHPKRCGFDRQRGALRLAEWQGWETDREFSGPQVLKVVCNPSKGHSIQQRVNLWRMWRLPNLFFLEILSPLR